MDVKQRISVPVTRDFLFEACALVYSKWARAYDALKIARTETDDGSTDWQLFHEERLKRATADEARWLNLCNEAALLAARARAEEVEAMPNVPKVTVYVVLGITDGEPDDFAMKVFADKADAEAEFETQKKLAEDGELWYLVDHEVH